MVNEDADSRPISVSELLARHQGDADATTSAKDSRNRRRAGRDGAVSMAELTGEVPRVSSDPTAEPRHISFPRADPPADRQPPTGGALTSSGMPSYSPAAAQAPEPVTADNEATGIIGRVDETAPGAGESSGTGGPGVAEPAVPEPANPEYGLPAETEDAKVTAAGEDDDFDSYRSFSDVEVEPEVKQPRRGLFGRRKARGGGRQAPDEADGPTEAIAKTFDRTEPVAPVTPTERTDVIDRTGTDEASSAELTDRTDVIERTDAPDATDTADAAADSADLPDDLERTGVIDRPDDLERPDHLDRPDDLERTGGIERPDDLERTGVIARTGFGTPDDPAERGDERKPGTGGPSEYLANLYSGAPGAGGSGSGDDLRPGETTEVIEPIGDDAPAAAAPLPNAYRLDTQGAPGDDAPDDQAPGTERSGDDEGGTVAHDFGDLNYDEPEVDPTTRAAQARAARAGAAKAGGGKKRLFGRKSAAADDTAAHDTWTDAFGSGSDEPDADESGTGEVRDLAADGADEPAGSAARTLAEKTSAAKKAAQKSSTQKDSARKQDPKGADAGHERSPAVAWALLIGESILGIAVGIGLFWGFKRLWEWNVPFALVLSVVVIFSIVTLTHVVRRSRDLATTLLAVGVGLLVTIGPLVLLAT